MWVGILYNKIGGIDPSTDFLMYLYGSFLKILYNYFMYYTLFPPPPNVTYPTRLIVHIGGGSLYSYHLEDQLIIILFFANLHDSI